MTPAASRPLRDQRGAALLAVLVMVVIVGLVVGIAGASWQTIVQRAREAELFWRGDQYRRAIQSYFEYGSGAKGNRTGQFPAKLEHLLKDPRSLTPKKHIRRLFIDPMTGGEWILIKDKGGRIIGVHSASTLEPFKKDDFPEDYETFAGAASYESWEFHFQPTVKPTGGSVKPKATTGSGEEP